MGRSREEEKEGEGEDESEEVKVRKCDEFAQNYARFPSPIGERKEKKNQMTEMNGQMDGSKQRIVEYISSLALFFSRYFVLTLVFAYSLAY